MASIKRTFRYLMKQAVVHNPFDPLYAKFRKVLDRLGWADAYDDMFYRQFAMPNFYKIWGRILKLEWTSTATVPQSGPAVFISNHLNVFDPFIVATPIPRIIKWVSKQENFEMPIFKSVCTHFRTIPLRRGESDQNAIGQINRVLAEGGCVGLFPEGTRSRDGHLHKFHNGAARFCIEHKCPYIPLASDSTYHLKPGQHVKVYVGNPVYIDPEMELTYENASIITREMHKDVEGLLNGVINKTRIITNKSHKPVAPPLFMSYLTEIRETMGESAEELFDLDIASKVTDSTISQ